MANRQLTAIDQILTQLDQGLRTVLGNAPEPQRVSPAVEIADTEMSDQERQHAIGLMRVNHAGEICAQALYQGQALTAKLPETGKQMEHAQMQEALPPAPAWTCQLHPWKSRRYRHTR